MSNLKGYLAKLGFTTAAAGSAAVLAFSAGSDLDASNRTGWYADITPGSEHLGLVAGGVESAHVLTTGFDVFGELRVTTNNGGLLRMTDTGLTYNPAAVGHNFEISRSGHFITGRVSNNYASFRFSRTAALQVGATTDGITRGLLVMEGNHPLYVTIDGTDVGRFLKTQLSIDVATASTDTTTGALVVAGGVGIAGKLFVGDDLSVDGKLTVTGLIDPTGLQFDTVATNPGNALTLWVDSENADTLMFGADPVVLGEVSTTLPESQIAFGSDEDIITSAETLAYDPVNRTFRVHDFFILQPEDDSVRSLWFGSGAAPGDVANVVAMGVNIPAITGAHANSIWIGNGGSGPFENWAITIGRPNAATRLRAITIGVQGGANAPYGIAIGQSAFSTHENSVAIGHAAETTKANQFVLGAAATITEVFIPATTASTSTTTGALVVAGGVGIAEKLFVGDDLSVDGKLTVTGLIDPTGLELTPVATNPGGVVANTLWVDSDGGVLRFGSEKVALGSLELTHNSIFIGNEQGELSELETGATGRDLIKAENQEAGRTALGLAAMATEDDAPNAELYGRRAGAWELLELSDIDGEIGTGQVAFGTDENTIGGSSLFTYASTQATGGLSIGNTTASTSTTTGALVVAGGAGIAEKLFVGDDLSVDGKLTVTGLIDPTGLQFDAVAANPGDALTLWVDSENADTLVFGATPVIGGNVAGSRVAFGTGNNRIGGDDLFMYFIAIPGSEGSTGGLSIGNTTPSTSTTTGALRVAGGVGIGGDLNVAGDIKTASSVEVGAAAWTYYGDPDTNGSWRFGRDGDNTVFQRREDGSWVTKTTVEA